MPWQAIIFLIALGVLHCACWMILVCQNFRILHLEEMLRFVSLHAVFAPHHQPEVDEYGDPQIPIPAKELAD